MNHLVDNLNLVLKNSFRKKIRFILTCSSVLVAFFLLTTLAGISHALNASVSQSNHLRLITSHKISMTRSLPNNYQQKIMSLPGVEQVSYVSWFGGFYQNASQQLTITAVDHNSYFDMFKEYQLSEQQLTDWKNNRTGIIIGQGIVEQYGWKVGDKIPLNSSIWMNKQGRFSWEFTVSAIYKTTGATTDDKRIFFQHSYFDKARAYARNTSSWFSIKVAPNILTTDNEEMVIKAIDALFENTAAPTKTTTEQVFIKEQAQQFVDMAMVIKIVLVAVFFTLLLIVCNTMVQSLRERLNEIAMMKALGFSSEFLIKQVYTEALFITALGALMGSLLATITLSQVQHQFSDFLPGIAIAPEHYVHVLLLVIVTAAVCTLFPAISIKRLTISQTLGAKQ